MTSLGLLHEQFRAQGYRLTPQRRAIIQVLLGDHAHPTAEQIFGHVQTLMPDMSHATVYNTLRELVKINHRFHRFHRLFLKICVICGSSIFAFGGEPGAKSTP